MPLSDSAVISALARLGSSALDSRIYVVSSAEPSVYSHPSRIRSFDPEGKTDPAGKAPAVQLPALSRSWCMPNVSTFSMPPVLDLLQRWLPASPGAQRWIDPFVGDSPVGFLCEATNDLDAAKTATHHLEALDFLRSFADSPRLDGVLFDPPRNSTALSETMRRAGLKPSMQDTQGSWLSARRMGAAFLLKVDGLAICAGWNSGGLGRSNGCELLEVLLVAHGGSFPDTIVTVERKTRETLY